ncbi:ARM repeat-containing protein [Metschnikowia bicuspidata var. bicuspidata NRRL YB-4993]|uniref:Pumilio homology domain family member 3 n=1 Tax=Metschnikowia bicuspidata var. bicuspidata NRRL YB-4993 TaxID=869754 RepID=A0A1A0HHU8_9ASCO|nr:ARM repeat-containing protein [Metschnikowia bicuspidata var. bicuspidata NRRL YB-4993]OBA23418.1 ARM repeat-containing protein [Metschnikowia bicuspidata var. bicuspidata NRRL YB-4993]
MPSETIWSNNSKPPSPNTENNYRSVLELVDTPMSDLLGSARGDQRSFSFTDSGEFEGNLFDFKSSIAQVSYAASTGGPHSLAAPRPAKATQAFPLGTASISGGIANRHPPQDSFLSKFASIADATKEIELSNSLGSLALDSTHEAPRRTSFNSELTAAKAFNMSPHSSLNENLNMPARSSRHQSISEKIDNYNNNSPIQATAALSTGTDPNVHSGPGGDKLQNKHPNFWNPATATSFTPHQNFNYFLDGAPAHPQAAFPRGGPFFPAPSPPPFVMNGVPFMDGGMYGMMPYMPPIPPMESVPTNEERTQTSENGSENKPNSPNEAEKQVPVGFPGIGLMNRGFHPGGPGFMFQPFNPYSIYGPVPSPGPVPPVSMAAVERSPQNSPDIKHSNKSKKSTAAPSSGNHTNNQNTSSNSQGKKGKSGRGNGGGKSAHHIYRSPLLEEVRSNSKGKEYFLKDIYGHVVEFTKDQHGSRFIQQKLPSASDEEKEIAFNEIRDISYELMTDVFGNYVIQKFFEHGSDTHKQILLESMISNVYELSLQMYGCRVVQRALEFVPLEGQITIVNELKSYILVCAKDQNGNHVIQKSIEKIPFEFVRFILDSLRDHIYHLATHPYGCRVIQRLLEFSNTEDQQFILAELKKYIFYLIQDQYGNYVIQHILEHGAPEDQEEILQVVLGSVVNFSKHKFASNVIEKCIKHGSLMQRQRILDEVMLGNEELDMETVDDESPLAMMMKDQYANYVIQKLVEGFDPKSQEKRKLVMKLRQYLQQLSMKNNYGKHLASVEKMIAVAETALVESDRA